MNRSAATKFSWLAVLLLTVASFTGCRTAPPVDWNERVGNYNYDDAVIDLGPPDKQARLSDGKTVAEWITHREGGARFSVGTGFYGGGGGVGVGQSVGTGYPDKVLELTFGTNNVLTAWSKNY